MWIFTSRGFVSAVQHRDDPDCIIVRARTRAHLEAFLGPHLVPANRITEDMEADYRWRATVTRRTFELCLSAEASAIDYPNFKDSITERAYVDAAHEVWSVMWGMQKDDVEAEAKDRFDALMRTTPAKPGRRLRITAAAAEKAPAPAKAKR